LSVKMKISDSWIWVMSDGLGSKEWASTPGGKSKLTSVFSPPIALAKSYRGKRVVITFSLF